MADLAKTSVRLTPELQAAYQQAFNDPAQKGSQAWMVAARGLVAAGVVQVDPADLDLANALETGESLTEAQSL